MDRQQAFVEGGSPFKVAMLASLSVGRRGGPSTRVWSDGAAPGQSPPPRPPSPPAAAARPSHSEQRARRAAVAARDGATPYRHGGGAPPPSLPCPRVGHQPQHLHWHRNAGASGPAKRRRVPPLLWHPPLQQTAVLPLALPRGRPPAVSRGRWTRGPPTAAAGRPTAPSAADHAARRTPRSSPRLARGHPIAPVLQSKEK